MFNITAIKGVYIKPICYSIANRITFCNAKFLIWELKNMLVDKANTYTSELFDIIKRLSERNLARLLSFARGLEKNEIDKESNKQVTKTA